MTRKLLLVCLMMHQLLLAEVEKNISLLDFIELYSLHNNVNVFIDDNISKDVSLFVPEDIKPQDYHSLFQISLEKLGYSVSKKGEVYFIQKYPEPKNDVFSIDLTYNCSPDVEEYLKFKNIPYQYSSSANRFFINTHVSKLGSIAKDIKFIDKPKKQTSIKFTILEFTNDGIEQIGTDLTASTLSSEVKSVLSAMITPQTSGKFVFQNEHFYSVLNLYSQKKDLSIVQNPFILIQDGKEFNFQAVTNLPFKTSESTTSSTIDSEKTTIEYKDIGLKISGTPFINNNFVNLDLNISIEDILSIVDNTPTTYKRFLKSNTNLKKGEVLILSGIQQVKTKLLDYSVPFISNIPYLGEVFKYKSSEEQHSYISIAIELVDDSEGFSAPSVSLRTDGQ